MAALVCDLCGGKLTMGSGGIAICESCGMEHSPDRMKEKVQEVKGTVRVDNSHMIENYLEMANRAYQSSNNAEAEKYCNKIIEIEPDNYQALMLKGKTAGWQSTLDNNRFAEAINCFSSAIINAPEEEKENLIDDAKSQVEDLSLAIIDLQGQRFEKWPDDEEAGGLLNAILEIYKALMLFATSIDIKAINKDELMAPIATKINNFVINAWNNKIVPEYSGDSDGYPDDYAFNQLLSRAEFCTTLLEQAIGLSDEDDESDIARYNNMISIHEYVINSCSYEYRTVEIKGSFWNDYQNTYENRYCKNLELTDKAKASRRRLINDYSSKIDAIKSAKAAKEAAEKAEKERIAKEEAKKRFDAYWAEHINEKASLEAERNDLNSQITALNASLNEQVAALNKEIASIPGKSEINNYEERIKKLTEEKSSLGLFKGKKKRAIQEQIQQANIEIKNVQDRMESAKKEIESKITSIKTEFKKKIFPLQSRVSAIGTELTKAR